MIKIRVLCTEDDDDSREMLSMFLRSSGYEVVCTSDAHEALRMATDEQFDLFLFDNWLPTMSGIELTKAVRQFDHSTPIVFYSGAALSQDRQAAFEAGAQEYLLKPDGIQVMTEVIERLVRKPETASSV